MDITQSLESLGLEEKQAKLYTFLLKQPEKAGLSVFSIAKNIDMPRSTVYLTLQELEAKRLVSSYKKNNVLHYLTADPSRLTRDLEEKQDLLKSIMPSLQALSHDSTYNSSVQTFTGEKGVRIVFDDCFNGPNVKNIQEYQTISHPKLVKYLTKSGYFEKKMDLKRKLDIPSKMLMSEVYRDNKPKEYNNDNLRETRYIPIEVAFEGTLIIYGKKTALFSHRDNEVYSMIVDSPAITEMFRSIFMCLWNSLAKK